MRIDCHAHILPAQLPPWKEQFGYGGFVQLQHHTTGQHADMVRDDGRFFRRVQPNCWDAPTVQAEMQHCGVQRMVLCTVPVMFNYHIPASDGAQVARYLNDDIARTQHDHPDAFWALGTLPLQNTELAVAELRRCALELLLPGIQIGSHVNAPDGWLNLSDPRLFPVFEAAQDLGMAILVHPWDMMAEQHMGRYWLPWLVGMPAETSLAICSMIFGGVFERLPNLRVCFAHGGGSFPATFGRIQHGWDVRPDLVAVDNPHPPSKYLGQFWVDSHTCDEQMMRFTLDLLGRDKMCFGTDYPFPLGEWHNGQWQPGKMLDETTLLTPEEKRMIFGPNVTAWLLG
jgi:aminocarboxymuconate-semialdehyde decarboxylase